MIAQLRRWADPIGRIIFIYLLLASFMLVCGVIFNRLDNLSSPSYGDDIPFLGFVCVSFPFALVPTGIVFFFLNRKALREERSEKLAQASEEKSG